jgi:hypothetical protein
MSIQPLYLRVALAFSALALGDGSAHAAGVVVSPPPAYGAYVVGYAGPSQSPSQQVFQNGVLPTPSYNGQAAVTLAGAQASGLSASADLGAGDLTVSANGLAGYDSSVFAIIYSQLTFQGSGTGTINFNGTLVKSGSTYADEYVGIAPALSIPEAGYSLPFTSGSWSGSSNFSFYNGETEYLIAQLSAGTYGPGSITVTDPLSITLSPGASFTAAAPTFLSAAPEPSSWALMLVGIGGLGLAMRKSKQDRRVAAV